MKKLGLAALAACTLTLPLTQTTLAAAPKTDPSFRFVISAGLTAGGDTIDTLKYKKGGSVDIKAGGLVQIGAGVRYQQPGSPFSLLGTVNYHVDNATAKNGDARFDRIPLELMGFYHWHNGWQFGGGLRHTLNARFKESIDGQPDITIDYEDTASVVLQVGYGNPRVWGGLRYVNESFHQKQIRVGNLYADVLQKTDGSHVGLFGYYAF
jgi:hypothetical protein